MNNLTHPEPAAPSQPKGFLAALDDFSFNSFIAVEMAKLLYGIALVFAAIQTLCITAMVFGAGKVVGIFFLLFLSVPLFIALPIVARLCVEMTVVVFRIGERVSEIAEAMGRKENS